MRLCNCPILLAAISMAWTWCSPADAVTLTDYFNDYGTASVRPLYGLGSEGNGWAGPWLGTTLTTAMGYERNNTSFINPYYSNAGNAADGNDGRAFFSGGDSSAGQISTRTFSNGLTGEIWVSTLARHGSNTSGDLLLWFDTSSSGSQANTLVGMRNGDIPNLRFSGSTATGGDLNNSGKNVLLLSRIRVNESGSNDSIDFWVKGESDDLSSPAALGAPLLSNSGSDAFGAELNYIGVSAGVQAGNFDGLRISNDANAFDVVMGMAQPPTLFDYDLVVYGGTAGGMTAAVQAARMGKSVAVVEPTTRIGGMTTNGLGFTDSGNRDAIQGMAREFYARRMAIRASTATTPAPSTSPRRLRWTR